ncbi:hypothetical protein E3E12_07240 [Formicincola oecophyllae]|uniref:Uncharacterized protein n=1 Tax=Formicincola oecophyllae TaxID=2558361 RepID=A0A4Y6UAE6_9PROT|nr:hypothetical protein E3E12_07240 [Formicincola oecophyllae]
MALAKPAHADRIISDYEASKLTFSALTATPHRAHRHVALHMAGFHRSAGHAHGAARLRTVSYHRASSHAHASHAAHAAHHLSLHKPSHRRHG